MGLTDSPFRRERITNISIHKYLFFRYRKTRYRVGVAFQLLRHNARQVDPQTRVPDAA